jgi:hypothetical protein
MHLQHRLHRSSPAPLAVSDLVDKCLMPYKKLFKVLAYFGELPQSVSLLKFRRQSKGCEEMTCPR